MVIISTDINQMNNHISS